MIGRHEVLDVKPAGPARGQDHGLGPDDRIFLGFQVEEDGPGARPMLVQDQLDGRRKFEDLDLIGVVLDLVAECPHHLGAGDVAGVVHPLARRPAAVHRLEPAVLVLGEHGPQLLQPGQDLGRLEDQRLDQLGVVLEMAAAHGVQIMVVGGVLLGLGRRLDAALGHHGVGVAHAQLGGDDDLGPVLLGQERRGRARSAAADDQDVGLIIHAGEVQGVRVDPALGMQQADHLVGDPVTLVRADEDLRPSLLLVIGVVLQDRFALLEGHGA